MNPEVVRLTPAATFLVLILCQFAIAMLVLILVHERAEQRLIGLTETDSLTGIHNRHWLMDRLPRQAVATGDMLRKAVEELSLTHEGVPLKVTLCVGVAVASEVMSSKGLVARADEALYVAKRAGRNRVHLHDARLTASPEAGMAAATAGW
eukprot:gene520-599_t